jgi:hypothetical protein
VDAREVSGPPEPEQGYREDHRSETRWREVFFRGQVAVWRDVFGLPTAFPIDVHWESDKYCPYEDTQECEAGFPWVKAVFFFKDDWKGLEPNIQNPIDKGDVEVHQEDNGLQEAKHK